jgi:uncharacterized protein YuzE
MTNEPTNLGFLSLAQEIQDACVAEPEPSGRTRIEIVADDLGLDVEVDYEADMAYIPIRQAPHFVDRSLEVGPSVRADYDVDDRLLGVEVFLRDVTVGPEAVADIERVVYEDEDREIAQRGRLKRALRWVESWWTYYRHMWGPLCWTCAECREQNRWLVTQGYSKIGRRLRQLKQGE